MRSERTVAASMSSSVIRSKNRSMTYLGIARIVLPLAGLRKAQIHPARRRIRPARRDHLAARVEADPFRPVDVRIAEEGVLPAAERVVRDRDRDRHVDADHADLDVELELARDA